MSHQVSVPNLKCGDSRALPRGYTLGQYRLEGVLGRGGFGFTYLATSVERDGSVSRMAIKELFPQEGVDRGSSFELVPVNRSEEGIFNDAKSRFYAEAVALKKCRHPNIVKILDYFAWNNTGYIIMHYEDGEQLGTYLKNHYKEGGAPQEWILSILIPLLDGLSHAHAQGVFHRDLKPQNIFLTAGDQPVLLDFGAAKQLNQKHRHAIGVNSQLIVTEGYAPFEQYHHEGHIGPWTDLYAMGAVAHLMIVGRTPPDAYQRAYKDSRQPLSGRPELISLYSPGFLAAIDSALEFETSRRPQSTTEWQSRLQSESSFARVAPVRRRVALEKTTLLTRLSTICFPVAPDPLPPTVRADVSPQISSTGQGLISKQPTDILKLLIGFLMVAGVLIVSVSVFLLLFK